MKIYNDIEIVKKKGVKPTTYASNILGEWKNFSSKDDCEKLHFLRCAAIAYKQLRISAATLEEHIYDIRELLTTNTPVQSDEVEEKKSENELIISSINGLINFFKEFDFEPNFRFINTFYRQNSYEKKVAYVKNYFALVDSCWNASVNEKMQSDEFKFLCNDFEQIHSSKVVNTRFKLYYGSQGTGKTTQAMHETDRCVMVCHSAMLPSDLMEDFSFDDGKAAFKPSALMKAMQNGTKIVLDEINLLPFESLRFLQSILDNKSQIEYKGMTVEIKDGFEIIGTMNLKVNGVVYNLPEPLVDRASELKEFKLTADQLIGALI